MISIFGYIYNDIDTFTMTTFTMTTFTMISIFGEIRQGVRA